MAFSGPFAFTLAFIVFSLGFSLSLGVLTLVFNAKRYYFSRQLVLDGAAWLTIAYVLNVIWLVLWLLGIYYSPTHGEYYGRVESYTSTLYTIWRLLFGAVVCAAVIAVQFRLTLSLRLAAGLPDGRERADDRTGFLVPVRAEQLVVAAAAGSGFVRLVMMLLFVHRRTFYPLGPLPGLIGFVELGLAIVLLFAAGVSYLYAAATEPKMASLLPTRKLLIIMTGLTVVRQVYYLCYAIFVGLYSITPQNNTVMPVPVWLPAATAILSPWTIAICLTMACLTLRKDVGSIRDLVHDWRPEVDVKPAGPLLSHRRRDTDTSWFQRPADGAAVS